RGLTVIMDNTFCTSVLFDAFQIYREVQKELGEPKVNFVYIESMSKFYRAGDKDEVNAGVIVASPSFIEECDAAMARLGSCLANECLKRLPANLMEPLEARLPMLAEKARQLAEWLWPQSEVRFVGHRRVGGVVYMELDTDDIDVATRFADTLDCPIAASFGHPITTIIPMGAFDEGKPGEIRIALGYKEDVEMVKVKFEEAFKVLRV
ncbi:MAG: hypothetical protein U9N42_02790, partial [Campylobacterota bacterium]|nr:hypothetical protein [Campylobacterota bacterium]